MSFIWKLCHVSEWLENTKTKGRLIANITMIPNRSGNTTTAAENTQSEESTSSTLLQGTDYLIVKVKFW